MGSDIQVTLLVEAMYHLEQLRHYYHRHKLTGEPCDAVRRCVAVLWDHYVRLVPPDSKTVVFDSILGWHPPTEVDPPQTGG